MTSQTALNALADAALGTDSPASAFLRGFEAGRRAEPMEEEVNAAAEEFYAHLSGNIFHGALDDDGAPMLDADPFHDVFIDATKAALFASRKGLTE